jgi:hypothetical protein
VIGCVRSKNPEGPKDIVHIDHIFQKTHVEGSSISSEITLGESAGGSFEASEDRRAKVILNC